MTIEMQVKIKDEKTTHTEKEILQLPLELSKSNRELLEKIGKVYTTFMQSSPEESKEAPEITLKFKMIWQR